MMGLLNWLDDRTGIRGIIHETLYERVPGGARWRYVWGSTLAFTFFVQLVTGFFLWTAYSPSSLTAWESVYYIQHEMTGGWLLRGIHHFTAQAMIVLMVLHVFQVVIDGAYKAPREINFWLGLVLMLIVLGLSLTGYLLPWDQKGYYGTKVATEIAQNTPLVGSTVQQLLVGGSDYGHQTVSRFFALHAGLLPALMIGVLGLHIALFRRQGLTAKDPDRKPDVYFWPDQLLRDVVACLAVLAVILFFCVRGAWSEPETTGVVATLGAELGSPADPAVDYSAARPEWYFLFLFQFLHYFGKDQQVMASIVYPSLVIVILFLMPIVGRWKLGHRFNVVFLFALLLGVVYLTGRAIQADYYPPIAPAKPSQEDGVAMSDWKKEYDQWEKEYQHYTTFQKGSKYEKWKSHRAVELAEQGIPAGGMLELLRNDPKTQGAVLFKTYCAGCHTHTAADVDLPPGHEFTSATPTAANLYRFGSYEWIRGILDPQKIVTSDYFGATEAHAEGEMVGYVVDDMEIDDADLVNVAHALAADADRPDREPVGEDLLEAGRTTIVEEGCVDCHQYGDEGDLGSAPDLTDYASRQWLIDLVSNPAHERFYEYVDDGRRMPAFHDSPDDPAQNILRQEDVELIVDFLRGDWYRSKHGRAATPPPAAAADAEAAQRADAAAAQPADDDVEPAAAGKPEEATTGEADAEAQ